MEDDKNPPKWGEKCRVKMCGSEIIGEIIGVTQIDGQEPEYDVLFIPENAAPSRLWIPERLLEEVTP